MTEYTLLQFPDKLVLCSDEPRKIGDYYVGLGFVGENVFQWHESQAAKYPNDKGIVIAGHGSLPSVDVTAIAETIGWVDVSDEAERRYPVKRHMTPDNSPYVAVQRSFLHGVKFGQELNKNKFTEEDMKACWEAAELATMGAAFSNSMTDIVSFHQVRIMKHKHDYFSKQQYSKQWRVEVDMIDNFPGTGERVRITNNTIKVTKVIKQ